MTDRFGLTDEQFWTAPYATKAAVQDALSKADFVGVRIDAPERVLFEQRETLPVVGCHAVTFREARTLSFDKQAVLVAVRPEDGRLLCEKVEVPRRQDAATKPTPRKQEEEDPGEGKYYRMFLADARRRLDVPWRAGTWLVSVHLGPHDSNRARVELDRPRTAYKDPAVDEARAQAAKETWPEKASPAPGQPLPSYTKQPTSLRPPEQVGIKLLAPRRTVVKRGAQVVLQAAFRLPVAARHLVRPKPDDPAWSVGAPGAKAVVPVVLVVTGEDPVGPFVVPLQVPCFEAPAGGHVTGQLALDLLAAPDMQHATPQRYRLRAFAGEVVAGPVELELVAPGAKE